MERIKAVEISVLVEQLMQLWSMGVHHVDVSGEKREFPDNDVIMFSYQKEYVYEWARHNFEFREEKRETDVKITHGDIDKLV